MPRWVIGTWGRRRRRLTTGTLPGLLAATGGLAAIRGCLGAIAACAVPLWRSGLLIRLGVAQPIVDQHRREVQGLTGRSLGTSARSGKVTHGYALHTVWGIGPRKRGERLFRHNCAHVAMGRSNGPEDESAPSRRLDDQLTPADSTAISRTYSARVSAVGGTPRSSIRRRRRRSYTSNASAALPLAAYARMSRR